ncbi:Response regulator receiver domain-containing protein [Dyadobacter soli]|uniref:Response regulator receiver domain-containing protein n=1 Tax=Dyadobacter soli TaxID=659014 RepID=A0A1G7S880_9BACT|nr:sigma 54-interacting transcriptional regulator [Dyadobacter soli]SDG19208.1 Response regulator receiver domain-containing protein [Dyadobacter soli]
MRYKMLIVEDEFIVANDLRIILTQAGYEVCGVAASAEEADALLLTVRPNLVLLDIRLDGKRSGIDLARKLRAESLAFVYISANSDQETLEEAKRTDPYGFIVKPFRKRDLLVAIDIALYRHKHVVESRLKQEGLLESQLKELHGNATDPAQKLLKMARLLQPHIPFDLIACASWPGNAAHSAHLAYLRVGFDEYQVIGKQQLTTVSGLKEAVVTAAMDSSAPFANPAIHNSGPPVPDNNAEALPKLYLDSFKLHSYLAFPVAAGRDSQANYYFLSRREGAYHRQHIALLERVGTYMAGGPAAVAPVAGSPGAAPKAGIETSASPANEVFAPGFKGIVGRHPLLLTALDQTMQVAPYNTSVLILGESGTGKENIALSIHALSPRKDKPFVKVNCAAIPAQLIESELFGHEKGAFTGASEKRKGKFEQADGGTIFLDEIGELPLEMQVKLLRILQEKEFEYVGSSSTRKVNVRIVAATNRNLEKEVANGTFRLDLYYRLNAFPISLPALRERKSDIEALASYFADKFCKEFGKAFHGIEEAMLEEMTGYDWPGNIRELVNVIEQAVILGKGNSRLELKRALPGGSPASTGKPTIKTLSDVKHIQNETERDYITSILIKANGIIRGAQGAAEMLNIKPTTLEARMAKLGIKREDFTKKI